VTCLLFLSNVAVQINFGKTPTHMKFHRLHPIAVNLFLAYGQMDTHDEDISCILHLLCKCA
jgi:hypothetical protein